MSGQCILNWVIVPTDTVETQPFGGDSSLSHLAATVPVSNC